MIKPPDAETDSLLLGVAEIYVHRWMGDDLDVVSNALIEKATSELHDHLRVAYMLGLAHEAQGGPLRDEPT